MITQKEVLAVLDYPDWKSVLKIIRELCKDRSEQFSKEDVARHLRSLRKARLAEFRRRTPTEAESRVGQTSIIAEYRRPNGTLGMNDKSRTAYENFLASALSGTNSLS